MTYEQIQESIHIGRDSINKYLNELEIESNIKITRRNMQRNNSCENLPNKYIVTNEKINTNNNSVYCIVEGNIKELETEFVNNVVQLFSKKELKDILPNNQYRTISKLYA